MKIFIDSVLICAAGGWGMRFEAAVPFHLIMERLSVAWVCEWVSVTVWQSALSICGNARVLFHVAPIVCIYHHRESVGAHSPVLYANSMAHFVNIQPPSCSQLTASRRYKGGQTNFKRSQNFLSFNAQNIVFYF